MSLSAAFKSISETRASFGKVVPPAGGGVYGFFLKKDDALKPFPPRKDGLVYIGCSRSLAAREYENHFHSDSTGFSTLRRSIGAILKEPLKLEAFPRSSGASATNVRNYKFNSDGEARLTAWMKENLEVGFYATQEFEIVEGMLLSELGPPLNLKGCDNPYAGPIKELRALCVEEAKSNRR